MKLTQGVAFVVVHDNGERELHVFTESGTLKLPDTAVRLYQVGAEALSTPIFGMGTFTMSGGGGGRAAPGSWSIYDRG